MIRNQLCCFISTKIRFKLFQPIYLSTFEWHQYFEADLFISLFWMRYPYFEAVAECHVDWNELVTQLKWCRPRLKDCVLKVLRSSSKIFKIVGRIIYSTTINNLFFSSWFKNQNKNYSWKFVPIVINDWMKCVW